MHALRPLLFASALVIGCSGPGEYTPLVEPDGTASPPFTTAQTDTPACLPEGAEIAGDTGAGPSPACCQGLTKGLAHKGSILRLDVCEPEGDGHAFCIRCGDGKCGVGENTCNCEADCRWP